MVLSFFYCSADTWPSNVWPSIEWDHIISSCGIPSQFLLWYFCCSVCFFCSEFSLIWCCLVPTHLVDHGWTRRGSVRIREANDNNNWQSTTQAVIYIYVDMDVSEIFCGQQPTLKPKTNHVCTYIHPVMVVGCAMHDEKINTPGFPGGVSFRLFNMVQYWEWWRPF